MKGKHAAPSKFDIEIEELRARKFKAENGRKYSRKASNRKVKSGQESGQEGGQEGGQKGDECRASTCKRGSKGGKRKLVLVVLLAAACFAIWAYWFKPIDVSKFKYPDWISQQFITQDGHSRTGLKTERINAIVIHYTANPGATAQNNRDYFNSPQSNVSSHFVVGLEGEVIQCVPLDEQSSASNRRNVDTISIEVCHPDSTGEFSIPSYNAAVKLCVWLCQNLRLDSDDIIRHYDCEGADHKLCPKYYVEHPDSWEKFKGYVEERL